MTSSRMSSKMNLNSRKDGLVIASLQTNSKMGHNNLNRFQKTTIRKKRLRFLLGLKKI